MFALLLIIAYLKGAIRGLRPIYLADHRLSLAWTLFFLVVLLQAMHSFLRWGNPMVSLLGIAFYLGPIAALLMGLAYARSQRWIERFLIGYVLIIAPAALSTYLSLHFSEQWAILRDIGTFTGTHLIIYDQGTIMFSHPGVFRVGELAGWHAMTSIAFLSVLAIRRRSFFLRLLIGILVIALVGAIMLTGRRKMLMTVLIFFAFQSVILILLKKGFNRVTGTILIMVTATTLAFILLGQGGDSTQQSLYVERGKSVFAGIDDRLQMVSNLMRSAWWRSEVIGVGAGVAGQGSRYVGGSGARAVGGSAESGFGLIIVELGAAGVLVIIWLFYRLTLRVWRGMRMLASLDGSLILYAATFLAFLIANLATFGAAAQLYSDLAVLITIGLVAGMLFSLLNHGIQAHGLQMRQTRSAYAARPGDIQASPLWEISPK